MKTPSESGSTWITFIPIILFLVIATVQSKYTYGQQISVGINYNSDGQTSGRLAASGPTWGGYIASYPDVSWVSGETTETCWETRHAYLFGLSRSFGKFSVTAGFGQGKKESHCADNDWIITKYRALECGVVYELISHNRFTCGIDWGVVSMLGCQTMIYSGIIIGIKTH
jgi:hypothetical protein